MYKWIFQSSGSGVALLNLLNKYGGSKVSLRNTFYIRFVFPCQFCTGQTRLGNRCDYSVILVEKLSNQTL